MRQILIDHERAHAAQKRGGGARKLGLEQVASLSATPQPDLLELNRALDKLQASDARKAQVVELLYFGGLTAAEAAEVLGITSRTVERDWQFARAWLYREVSGRGAAG
jgi:RNA polymerase sigma factor (TIGR02999 family)